MTARSRPEDIEYISRLKFGSQFSYTLAYNLKPPPRIRLLAEKGEPVIATTPIEDYSTELRPPQPRMKAIPGPCPRDTVNDTDCSAVKRIVIDYGDLRQQISAAREKD